MKQYICVSVNSLGRGIIVLLVFLLVNKIHAQVEAVKIKQPTVQASSQRKVWVQRESDLKSTRKKLEQLIKQKRPVNLDSRAIKNWDEQTEWLKNVVKQLAAYQKKLQHTLKNTDGNVKVVQGKKTISAKPTESDHTSQLDIEFVNLQNSLQMESRRFQTISNATKVRHDSATATIRNMK